MVEAVLLLSAAFDSVTHDVLVQRLQEEFSVTDTCCQWIRGYLTGRSFTVCHQYRCQPVYPRGLSWARFCTPCTSHQSVVWLPVMEFLPRDASAERGYEIACRLSVRLSF